MTYATGTISGANTGQLLINAMDAVIVAETGLSKVSSAIVVGTNTWNVYKSAAANNSFGQDFHFALGYVTATPTTLLVTVFEGWDTGTLLATRYPPNATVTPNGTFANPGAALALPSTGTAMGYSQSVGLTSSGAWYLSVTVDRIILSFNTSTNVAVGYYIGLYDSFNTTTIDPFPLVVVNFNIPTSVVASSLPAAICGLSTREPNTSTSNSTNFVVLGGGVTGCSWTLASNTLDAYKNFNYLSRLMLQGRTAPSYRGLLKDVYIGPTQTNNGDTVTWQLAGNTKVAVRAGIGVFGVYFLTV